MPADTPPPLPMFYRRLAPLDPARHQGLRMPVRPDLTFTAATNSIPVLREEFYHAARFYPIVFANGENPLPIALVGLRDRENLFLEPVDALQGRQWRSGAYLPAYIRRYPFALVPVEGREEMAVCIDDEAVLGPRDGEFVFGADGQLTAYGQEIVNLCQSFEAQIKQTELFSAALRQHQLLDVQTATVTLAGGERFSLSGFLLINEQRFNALPAAVLADWRDQGFLALAYAHFLSLTNWQTLVDLTTRRAQAKDERPSRDPFLDKVLYNA